MDIENIYREATGVDISEETDKWDERGKGYYGEFLVFQNALEHLKGFSKLMMNLEIPTGKEKKYGDRFPASS